MDKYGEMETRIVIDCEDVRRREYGRQRAAHLLAHYFSLLFDAAGQRWDLDNEAEMHELVDAIADMIGAK